MAHWSFTGGDDGFYVIRERSARVYSVTVAEAETLGTDILRLVEQIRAAGPVA